MSSSTVAGVDVVDDDCLFLLLLLLISRDIIDAWMKAGVNCSDLPRKAVVGAGGAGVAPLPPKNNLVGVVNDEKQTTRDDEDRDTIPPSKKVITK